MSKELFVECARTWIDTPFIHQGRLKTVGCDCLGLLVGVCKELSLKNFDERFLHELDEVTYSRMPNTDNLISVFSEIMSEVSTPEFGDIILFNIKNYPQHLAIVTDKGILHSYQTVGKVVEHAMTSTWKKRIFKIFRMKLWLQ